MDWCPTVHVKDGQLAHTSGELRSLGEAATWVKEHGGRMCLVDATALERNREDVTLYQRLGSRMELWLDAGPRNAGDIMDLVLAGASRVTVRTHLIRERELLEGLATCDDVVLGIQAVRGHVKETRRGTAWPVAKRIAVEYGLPIVVIDHARGGSRDGMDRDTAHLLHGVRTETWYAGGVQDARDLEILEGLKYHGALVGNAWLDHPRNWKA